MCTSSSGISYDHDWVAIDDAEVRIDYGWYSHIQHDTIASCLRISKQKCPNYKFNTEIVSTQNRFVNRELIGVSENDASFQYKKLFEDKGDAVIAFGFWGLDKG